MQDDAQSPESLRQDTPVAKLIRYRPSGTLFARVRIKGKLIRRSLRTRVLSVGKLRLGGTGFVGYMGLKDRKCRKVCPAITTGIPRIVVNERGAWVATDGGISYFTPQDIGRR